MSVIEFAKSEMDRAKFHPLERDLIIEMMESFFKRYDSGGAVWAMAPALEHLPVVKRLIACKPLTPLTGEEDEWNDVSESAGRTCWQSRRMPSVFREEDGEGKVWAYDIDAPSGRKAITFPYFPERAEVASPVITVG